MLMTLLLIMVTMPMPPDDDGDEYDDGRDDAKSCCCRCPSMIAARRRSSDIIYGRESVDLPQAGMSIGPESDNKTKSNLCYHLTTEPSSPQAPGSASRDA